MPIRWPDSTNKGTALLRLLHQNELTVLVRDEYVGWYFDSQTIESIGNSPSKGIQFGSDPESVFQRTAYWYTILREKYFDDIIEAAVLAGYEQLLLLGAGFDTRFFRLNGLGDQAVRTLEVDRPETVATKIRVLKRHLGILPKNLYLIPMDFNRDEPTSLFDRGLERNRKTVCIWQGVSYYLPKETVASVLDFIITRLPPATLLGFDCCTPLMTKKNDLIPGIAFNIDRLNEIGEPYLFGMPADAMEEWLLGKGFHDIAIWQQDQLEERYLMKHTLPDKMWYVVSAAC